MKITLNSIKQGLEMGTMTIKQAGEHLCWLGSYKLELSYREIVASVKPKRVVRRYKYLDTNESIRQQPLSIHHLGGYPCIVKCDIEVDNFGGDGFDFPIMAYIIDRKPKWTKNADLLSAEERKQIEQMCSNHTTI